MYSWPGAWRVRSFPRQPESRGRSARGSRCVGRTMLARQPARHGTQTVQKLPWARSACLCVCVAPHLRVRARSERPVCKRPCNCRGFVRIGARDTAECSVSPVPQRDHALLQMVPLVSLAMHGAACECARGTPLGPLMRSAAVSHARGTCLQHLRACPSPLTRTLITHPPLNPAAALPAAPHSSQSTAAQRQPASSHAPRRHH